MGVDWVGETNRIPRIPSFRGGLSTPHSHFLQLLPHFHSSGPDFSLEVPKPSIETSGTLSYPEEGVVLNYTKGLLQSSPLYPPVYP